MSGIRYCPTKACIHAHLLLARLEDTTHYLTKSATLFASVHALTTTKQYMLTLGLNIVSQPMELCIVIVQRWLQNVLMVLLIVGFLISTAHRLVGK